MEFLVISTVAAIMSAGIFTLAPPAWTWASRLPEERRHGGLFLREALARAAAAAGKGFSALRSAKKQELVHKELYSALSVLRNHASADSGDAPYSRDAGYNRTGACVTTDYLLEQFSLSEGALKDAFSGALRLFRTGRRAEAAEYFCAAAGVELARDFILLVLDWDAVPSRKLKQTVGAFQNALKETRTTELTRKNEVMSDLVYLPVITGVLIVFVNFIYVAYFAEQRALLGELFF